MKNGRTREVADDEVEIVEDDRRILADGTVEVRGHWVARKRSGRSYRREHNRSRPRRRR